jgi:hypothetical protein
MTNATSTDLHAELRRLVDDYRARCLWFLRVDYYPSTPGAWISVLEQIARHGDLEAFRRAGALQSWLSHHSRATSAGS